MLQRASEPSAGCSSLSLHRIAFEKQRLADEGGNHGFLIWLGNQERRLRSLAGEKAFRICRNEDHRSFESGYQVVDRFQPGASVGQLNVCQNKSRTLSLGQCNRL